MLLLLTLLLGLVLAPLLFFWIAGEKGRLLPSTRAFFRQSGFHWKTLHGYVYGRWTGRYLKTLFRLPAPSSSAKAHRAAQKLAAHYHGKVLTHHHAQAIVTLDRDVPLQEIEQIVPYPAARSIVLNGPPDIAAYECFCRHSRETHCRPTQVCMTIGKPFTDFVLEHHPDKARRLTRAEALNLLEAEHARGHVHSAWFKDAMLDRFYAICNCCKCCCGGISMMRQGVPMMVSSGYMAQIDQELCARCGDCVEACPFDSLSKNGEGTVLNWELCRAAESAK